MPKLHGHVITTTNPSIELTIIQHRISTIILLQAVVKLQHPVCRIWTVISSSPAYTEGQAAQRDAEAVCTLCCDCTLVICWPHQSIHDTRCELPLNIQPSLISYTYGSRLPEMLRPFSAMLVMVMVKHPLPWCLTSNLEQMHDMLPAAFKGKIHTIDEVHILHTPTAMPMPGRGVSFICLGWYSLMWVCAPLSTLTGTTLPASVQAHLQYLLYACS